MLFVTFIKYKRQIGQMRTEVQVVLSWLQMFTTMYSYFEQPLACAVVIHIHVH